jgi:octaprenyl-diphosphate synthase
MIALYADLQGHLSAVTAIMDRALACDERRVVGLVRDLGRFHGKMLRPALALLTAEAVGTVTARHHQLGASLELLHTATLIHDDLIDDADTRRGVPTAHTRFGNTTAVLLGDYLYTHAFDLVAQLGDVELIRRMTRTTNILCAGELHQQMAADDVDLSEDEYNRIIHAKTAVLCELSGAFGALDGTPAQRTAAAEYGRLCGMAFQVVDDCLDFSGDAQKVGKTLTTDLARGRMTLPVLRWLGASASERAGRERRLAEVRAGADMVALRAEIAAIGVPSALATARDYVQRAQAALTALPAGGGLRKLHELAEFIVARDF